MYCTDTFDGRLELAPDVQREGMPRFLDVSSCVVPLLTETSAVET